MQNLQRNSKKQVGNRKIEQLIEQLINIKIALVNQQDKI